jgi:FMN phosphatase YigB (HAD superfamily)
MRQPYRETILSFEVGSMKPEKRIYKMAEQSAEVPRERILFLDDKPENVRGAIERGWQAVHCVGGPAAASVLGAHGLLGNRDRSAAPDSSAP